MDDKLKPCPFCGSNRVQIKTVDGGINWYIICANCIAMCGYADSEDKAIEAWNRRAEQ